MQNDKDKILPGGEYKTDAIMGEADGSDSSGSLFDSIASDAGMRLNVLAKDTNTGEYVSLSNVPYKSTNAMFGAGITSGKRFILTASSYSDFVARNVSAMMLEDVPTAPAARNPAIPEQALVKNTTDSFRTSPSAACKKFSEREKALRKKLGLVHDRDDLVLMQGKKDGASPGAIINQDEGTFTQFDKSGKQSVDLGSSGLNAKAAAVDTGDAELGKNSMLGIPSTKNPLTDVVPSGTILMPVPPFMPNFRKIAATVLTVCDAIDFIVCCGEAVALIMGYGNNDEQDIINDASSSSGQKILTGDGKAGTAVNESNITGTQK